MNIKKLMLRGGIGLGTLGIIVAGAAAFSAFEAHVVNVTATIENALTVPVEQNGLTFGEMFPEEVSHVTLPISLSDSFMKTSRVDDVEYIIRQKPKCGIPVPDTNPVQYSGFTQVGENGDHNFVCPEGSVPLPLLCPYLSKNELNAAGAPTGNGIPAFHGLPGPWTETTTENTQVSGVLSKQSGATSTNWDIDLHTPCFKGECAQDWNKFVTDTNPSVTDPSIYEADPANEHQMFGCDLWVEVTGISLPNGTAPLTVTKIVVGTSTPVSAFSLFVDGKSVTSGVATTTSVGAHVVSEGPHAGYNSAISGSCDANGNVTISTSTPAFCAITNTWIQPTTGSLTVTKVVVGSSTPVSAFSLFVDGAPVTSAVPTTTLAGAHVVSEGPHAGFNSVISGNCDVNGNVTVSTTTPASCTVTNTAQIGTITVHKIVSDPGNLGGQTAGQFQMTIDGQNVAQDTPIQVSVGSHTIGEVDSKGDTATFSGDCNGTNQVSIANNDAKTCTVTNTIPFMAVTVTKVVHNNFGGTAIVSNFNLFVGSTQVTSGVSKNFAPGTYLITESGVSGYVGAFSGDCDSNTQQLTGAGGSTKACTITNTDIEPNVTLIANVVNGSATANQFIMHIDNSAPIPSGNSKPVFSNTNHQIEQDAFSGYSVTGITGTGCPSALNTNFTLTPGQAITCTINEHTP